jgi:hypothetical protein
MICFRLKVETLIIPFRLIPLFLCFNLVQSPNIKQQWENAKTWYNQQKTEAEVIDTTPLQQKVTDIETNIGGLGSAAARKEKEVKQHLQDLWESKGIGVKH